MSLAFLLISLIWTGALALGAEALTRSRVTPHFAQFVWRVAAGLMVLPWFGFVLAPYLPAPPPILPEFPDLMEAGLGAPDTSPAVTGTSEPKASGFTGWPRLIFFILVAGWIWRVLAAQTERLRLDWIIKKARPVRSEELNAAADRWAPALALRKRPKIAFIEGSRSPFVSGVFRPVIYLPKALQHCDFGNLIIAHECVHIARGDLISRPIERAVADLIWFSPFAWLARKRLDYWREAVCDAEAVKLTKDPVAYSRALAGVARQSRPAPALPVAAFILNSKRKTLPMRISSILEPTRKTSRASRIFGGLALLIAAPIVLVQCAAMPTQDKTQTFSSPVIASPYARVTSPFGLRADPFTRRSSWHSGVDIGGGKDPSPVLISTPADGVVVFSGEKSGYGRLVDLKLTTSGHIVRFAHLRELKVTEGQTLSSGDIIGIMGSSGRSTARHLHFEYIIDGKPYDPVGIDGLTLTSTAD